MTHTSGPWVAGHEDDPNAIMAGDNKIARVGNHKLSAGDQQLIAAAPDLLSALKLILDGANAGRWIDHTGEECGCDDEGAEFVPYTVDEQNDWILDTAIRCKEAIAKAEGRS